MLMGLAAGAAEEALCGYDPVPAPASSPSTEAPAAEERRPDEAPAAVPQGSASSGDQPERPQGQGGRGDEGRAAIPGARTGEDGEARPQGGPRYRDQGAAGGFLPRAALTVAMNRRGRVPGPTPRAGSTAATARRRACPSHGRLTATNGRLTATTGRRSRVRGPAPAARCTGIR
ncbi:hypothetical protein SSPO_044050 [Streptomyces antimycoticus]|uniref:Uncharacterized protein n=1 Tax=Streptomyces antimycoticus TaxID=68175 RepID=A0A499V6C6_9ACTN|nr:hypothetical protein SSPO_044050 [Streptomyces antimycoticus]